MGNYFYPPSLTGQTLTLPPLATFSDSSFEPNQSDQRYSNSIDMMEIDAQMEPCFSVEHKDQLISLKSSTRFVQSPHIHEEASRIVCDEMPASVSSSTEYDHSIESPMMHDKSTEIDQITDSWLSLIVEDMFMNDDDQLNSIPSSVDTTEEGTDERFRSTVPKSPSTCSLPETLLFSSNKPRHGDWSRDDLALTSSHLSWSSSFGRQTVKTDYESMFMPVQAFSALNQTNAHTQTMALNMIHKTNYSLRDPIGISPQSIDGSFVLANSKNQHPKPSKTSLFNADHLNTNTSKSISRFHKALAKVASNGLERRRRFSAGAQVETQKQHVLPSVKDVHSQNLIPLLYPAYNFQTNAMFDTKIPRTDKYFHDFPRFTDYSRAKYEDSVAVRTRSASVSL